jgi:hypothetical protein
MTRPAGEGAAPACSDEGGEPPKSYDRATPAPLGRIC